MDSDTWRIVLVAGLLVNAGIGLGYRVYRLSKGGPKSDVVGQAILGMVLAGLAVALAEGAGWPRWGALVYGLLFAVVVMPIWVLAVLIPLRPRAIDYAFTGVYWAVLVLVVVAALAS
ncbi:MAG TPA: hypothetical protein VHF58_08240 [Solirubrobacterales bacterium]|nr:hypothetical protein [Solirubrobacterales bacterium]